ncbi:hypothetical protein [Amphibacillus sediminis]|uniref:hypothetical protein n=1 Tax=Amphibacillus sediminis TaxID=360185 RepID=UPI0008301358|nr:hypothetical protein [Amphibacillus sediminis]
MNVIGEALKSPFNNLLGIFLYLTFLVFLTIAIISLLFFIIPNRLSNRIKSAITGTITLTVLIIWVYIAIVRQFN